MSCVLQRQINHFRPARVYMHSKFILSIESKMKIPVYKIQFFILMPFSSSKLEIKKKII